MRLIKNYLFALIFAVAGISAVNAQVVDTSVVKDAIQSADTLITPVKNAIAENDSLEKNKPKIRRPAGAALRSAILPGWGQVYNKKVWKVPIVYAAIGISGAFFINNRRWVKKLRYATDIAYKIEANQDSIGSVSYNKIDDQLKGPFFEANGVQVQKLRDQRDQFFRYMEYSAVYFVIGWALNVIDATVDAHLRNFDISPDLTFKIQPGYSEMAKTAGLSLVLQIK